MDNALAQNIMAGIALADATHLQTTELNENISGSLDDAVLIPNTNLAGAYTYFPVYYEILQQYNSSVETLPVFLAETYYDGVVYPSLNPTTATNLMLRKVAYWTVLSGGLGGYLYGSLYFDFHAGWQIGIDTPAATQLGYWNSLITSVPWYSLVPDQTNAVVTSGFGTATGNDAGNIQTDNFCNHCQNTRRFLRLILLPSEHDAHSGHGPVERPRNGPLVRSQHRNIYVDQLFAALEHWRPDFRHPGKQRRWRSRLGSGFAISEQLAWISAARV